MADNIDISKDLEQSIRDSRKLQGDTNSELNKSINLLSQINDLRDQSIAKVRSLNKESINTRDIQRELKKAKEKDELTLSKISKLESSLSDAEKQRASDYIKYVGQRKELEDELSRARLLNNQGQIAFLTSQLNLVDSEISSKENGLNIDERRYAAAVQSNKVAAETRDLLKEELNTEKEIQKSVGLTGVALGKFSEKLGLGTKYYSELVEKARELEEDGKKLTFVDKLKTLGKVGVGAIKETFSDPLTAIPAVAGIAVSAYKSVESGLTSIGNTAAKTGNFLAGLSKHSSNIVRDLASGVSDLARKIPLVGGLIGGLVDGFAALLDLMLGVDDYAVKLGRQINMDADASSRWARETRKVSFANGDIFLTQEKILESQVELATTLGVVNNLGGEIVAKNVKLKDFAGLELDTRSKLAELTKISGKDATNAILAQVKGLQRSTGIAFQYQAILKEAASQSGYLGLQFSKFPAQMTKTLLTVKAMGMELKQVEAIGDSLLDFESSISKEFEAQLLTGKEINLAKAREAFLNNDLATAAAEITKQVGSTEDFLKLNRIQAESLASAFGMSRDQMGDMLRQQELLAKLGAKQGDSAREQLRLGLERYGNEKALSEAIGEQAYQSMVSASTQEKLAATIEKIKESIVSFVMESGLFEKVKEFMDYLSKPGTIKGILGTIRDSISTFIEVVGEILADIIEVGGEIANFFTFGREGDERERKAYELGAKVREGSSDFAQRIKSMGGNFESSSIGEKAANSEVSKNVQIVPVDNMSMKPNTKQNLTFNAEVKAYIVDSKRNNETRLQGSPDFDIQTGKPL